MDAHTFGAGRQCLRAAAPIYLALTLAVILVPAAGAAPSADDTLPPAVATITETSASQFLAGTHTGTAVIEAAADAASSGALTLLPLFGDIFAAPELGAIWNLTRPSAGFVPAIADGVLDVQERDDLEFETSAVESGIAFDGGVMLEMRVAIHPGSAFVNVGFMDNTVAVNQWAYFSTRGSGDGVIPTIYTSVRGADGQMRNLPTTVTVGQWHDFQIVWTADTVAFHVDGVLIDTRTDVAFSLPLHAALFKSGGSDSPLYADWIHVTPHVVDTGSYGSVVHDAGLAAAPWTAVTWQGDQPAGTTVTVATRTGEVPVPGPSWSAWSDAVGDLISSPPGRYAQYRVTLTTNHAGQSPTVDAVTLSHTYPDAVAPSVLATVPAAGQATVAVDTPVTAVFSEALDATTVSASSFQLSPGVGADVTYDPDSFTATLTPTTTLAHGATYQARLTTAITDLDGNPLATTHAWSFTTTPADLAPPTVATALPAAGAIDVVVTRPLTVTFDEPVDPASLTATSVTLTTDGATVAADVTYDQPARRLTITPNAPLARATRYVIRLAATVADLNGNQLGEDLTWTFITSYLDAVDTVHTTAADFLAATLSNLVIAERDNAPASAQVRLPSLLEDRFDQPVLGDQWHPTNPADFEPVIANGMLDVQAPFDGDYDRSAIQSWDGYGPGVVLEARAMFVPGSAFIDVGFDANTLTNPQYAWFSSEGTGGQPGQERITARVRQYDHTTVAIDVPASYNQWHVYKIVWTVGHVDFYVDDALVATHADVLFTAPMHAAFYKTRHVDSPFYIDWIRVTPYTETAGDLESPVLDAGLAGARWRDLAWSGDTPAGTAVDLATRSGESPAPDGTWSTWTPVIAGVVTSPPGRYAQYRAALTTADPLAGPFIDAVRLSRTTSADVEPPSVTAADPDEGTAGVAPATHVRASFSEPLHPATVEGGISLVDEDGQAVAAAVSYSDATRTLTLVPADELRGGTTYTVRLGAALADTAANRLAAPSTWTFTTAALPGSQVPTPTVLHPAVPNPFNPSTRVSFDLGQSGSVLMRVFTIDGKFVRTLIRADLTGGRRYWKTWDGRDEGGRALPAGTYLVRMETAAGVQTNKMMLVH